MARRKALFISGSVGLGHAMRDLAIAKYIRNKNPEIEISWLAGSPGSTFLKEAGEILHQENALYANDTAIAERSANRNFHLNLVKYLFYAIRGWKQNVKIFERVTYNEAFDIIIADEAYELVAALMENSEMRDRIDASFVMIYDFVGNFAMGWNPLERLGIYLWNRKWAQAVDFFADKRNIALFVGEPEDVPDARPRGLGSQTCREVAEKMCHFTGYVLKFDPSEYLNKVMIRERLGYGEEPLIVCSIGGTSVGKDLLSLCAKAYPIMKEQIPDLHMVLVCGPRLSPESLEVPKGLDVRGYLPALYEHFAACDLSIIQAGGTSTLELTALRRPFLYFPLEGHWEQQIHVAGRLARHNAGIPMQYSQTTPEILAESAVKNMGKEVAYSSINADGAEQAAMLINQMLSDFRGNPSQ